MDLSRRLRVQGQTLVELQNTSNEKLLGTRFVHTEAFHFHVITLLSLTEYGWIKMLQFRRTAFHNEVEFLII